MRGEPAAPAPAWATVPCDAPPAGRLAESPLDPLACVHVAPSGVVCASCLSSACLPPASFKYTYVCFSLHQVFSHMLSCVSYLSTSIRWPRKEGEPRHTPAALSGPLPARYFTCNSLCLSRAARGAEHGGVPARRWRWPSPVPRRHWTAVVKPLVRGSRWYLRTGSPLETATSMLTRCFCSVKRVPSQYRRNWDEAQGHGSFRAGARALRGSAVSHRVRPRPPPNICCPIGGKDSAAPVASAWPVPARCSIFGLRSAPTPSPHTAAQRLRERTFQKGGNTKAPGQQPLVSEWIIRDRWDTKQGARSQRTVTREKEGAETNRRFKPMTLIILTAVHQITPGP